MRTHLAKFISFHEQIKVSLPAWSRCRYHWLSSLAFRQHLRDLRSTSTQFFTHYVIEDEKIHGACSSSFSLGVRLSLDMKERSDNLADGCWTAIIRVDWQLIAVPLKLIVYSNCCRHVFKLAASKYEFLDSCKLVSRPIQETRNSFFPHLCHL